MEYIAIVYLWFAILLYLVLGGADFGAGIIELFTSNAKLRRTRDTVYQAIGPIWEANHMWLIIAIVILFVGFPVIYSELSVYLHIPLLIMLMGIIARGTAFVFRHYDAVHDNMQDIYNRIFVWSSVITPLFLGIIAGSTLSGRIDRAATSFADAYVFSWLNWFSVAVGLFTVVLCGFLAAVYLIGEAGRADHRKEFVRKARNANMVAVVCGAFVFVAAEADGVPLVQWIFDGSVGLAAVVSASASLVLMWVFIRQGRNMIPRALAAFQVTMILLAVTYEHYPDVVLMRDGNHLSLAIHQAPASTLNALALALVLGSLFILPALLYLYYSFLRKNRQPISH